MKGWLRLAALLLLAVLSHVPARAQRRALGPQAPVTSIGSAWLQYDPASRLLKPFVHGFDPPVRVLYHWVTLNPAHSTILSLRARQGLCLFLNNQLILSAPATASYRLDLSQYSSHPGRYLFSCWHPSSLPDPGAFIPTPAADHNGSLQALSRPLRRLPDDPNRDVFILALLLVGLLYGGLRVVFGVSLSRFFQFEIATRQGGSLRPTAGALPSTPLTVLCILAFSLSFALLIVIVHSNIENAVIFRYLFPLSDLDISFRIALYTAGVFSFVLLRYLFLYAIGYVFDLTLLVRVQYREFIRTILLAGVYLPPIILLHLALSGVVPSNVLRFSNVLLGLMLLAAVVRSAVALHQSRSLLNLHLFSYLCATEVIPLIVLLKLIVFPYV